MIQYDRLVHHWKILAIDKEFQVFFQDQLFPKLQEFFCSFHIMINNFSNDRHRKISIRLLLIVHKVMNNNLAFLYFSLIIEEIIFILMLCIFILSFVLAKVLSFFYRLLPPAEYFHRTDISYFIPQKLFWTFSRFIFTLFIVNKQWPSKVIFDILQRSLILHSENDFSEIDWLN